MSSPRSLIPGARFSAKSLKSVQYMARACGWNYDKWGIKAKWQVLVKSWSCCNIISLFLSHYTNPLPIELISKSMGADTSGDIIWGNGQREKNPLRVMTDTWGITLGPAPCWLCGCNLQKIGKMGIDLNTPPPASKAPGLLDFWQFIIFLHLARLRLGCVVDEESNLFCSGSPQSARVGHDYP